MYEIGLSAQAQRDLARLDASTRERVAKKIQWLVEHAQDVAKQALTAEWARFFKLRAGDYRILHELKGQLIIIQLIRHRREVYD